MMQWIRTDSSVQQPVFIRRFSAHCVLRAVLEITGLGIYRAELNGKRVGNDYLTPGWNDYDAYVRFQTYDVTALLETENELRVTLGEGWYMGRLGMSSGPMHHWGDRFMMWARLSLTYQDGTEQVIETDEDWKACASGILMASLYDGEHRDDTFKASEELPVEAFDPGYCLKKPVSPPIHIVTELKPTLLTTPAGETVLDFGQNFSGVLRFENFLPFGEKILLQTGEVLQGGCFYRENLLTAKSEFLYVSDGVRKSVEEAFTFHGFRYVKVTCRLDIRPEDFTGVVLSSDLKETLRCETSHPLLNRLMENARWSRLSNFLDVPTDCPQRDERLGWTGDAQAFADTACFQADCKDFYRKYMEDLRIDQTRYYHGDLPMFSPSLRGTAGIGGAVWADAGIVIPWTVYMHYGDEALLRESYPLMRDYTEVRIQKDRDLGFTHVLFDEFTFGDWLALDGLSRKSVFGGTEECFIQGVYYLQAVELTGKAARVLGKTEDAERYEQLSADIRNSLMQEYVTDGGRLALDTQTAYVLALQHGLYHDRQKMADAMKRRLRRDFYALRCGFTGAPLLLNVLLDCGLVDEAYRILLSEEYPGWLYEILHGATTIWERWNSLEEDGRVSDTGMDSFNHYAYGAVCNAVYTRFMGLRCVSPGWKKAEIAPKVRGAIRRSRIEQETVSGIWKTAWEIADDGSFSLFVSVPHGCTAHVVLPDHPEAFEEDVGEGEHRYQYMPARDYLHPFDEHALILDIMRNPQADAIFAEHAPGLHALAWDPDSDVRAKHLDELSWGVPRALRAQADGLGEKLRKVELA